MSHTMPRGATDQKTKQSMFKALSMAMHGDTDSIQHLLCSTRYPSLPLIRHIIDQASFSYSQ